MLLVHASHSHTEFGGTIVADFTYIRDQIVINDDLKARIKKQKLPPGSTIRLVAQQIRHTPGFTLDMSGYNMVLVAGEYDNNGGSIDVSGAPGAAGTPGGDGANGVATSGGIDNQPGGTGSPGGSGQGGTGATSLRIICELLRGGEIRLFANGGGGGAGGKGGNGGRLLLDSRVVGFADVVPPNCCHPFLLEALLFQWP
jgi:hypothetical protein